MAFRSTRRAQTIVPFGVGSIVEFQDEALMMAGLDEWPYGQGETKLYDERLAMRLGVEMFKLPPPKPEHGAPPGSVGRLPYVRFPQYHFCPRCRYITKAGLFAQDRPRCENLVSPMRQPKAEACGSRVEKSRPYMLPLRFVAVCRSGHIEDFPWNAWAHSEPGELLNRNLGCDPERLFFYSTQRGGLGGYIVRCGTCDSKRNLMGVTSSDGIKGLACSGARPWLGDKAAENCRQRAADGEKSWMLALQRGASNLYFPEVSSSILIPPFSSQIQQVLADRTTMEAIESGTLNGVIPDTTFSAVARMRRVDAEALKTAYYQHKEASAGDRDIDEAEFRHAEYSALKTERTDTDDALICLPQDMSTYPALIGEYFSGVTLVEKLTETRAMTGFTRIEPGRPRDNCISLIPRKWLPAFRVRGEGVFLEVNPDKFAEFEANADSRTRGLVQKTIEIDRSPLEPSPGLILLHTLAHLIIKRMSFVAGYGASSIRERIYSSPAGSKTPMTGMLLYTSAGDADGTLGGLVGLGRPRTLEQIIVGALEDARWCGSDPICIESKGQGVDSCNLAACHACVLLPETSCEFQNRTLDREAVIKFFGAE